MSYTITLCSRILLTTQDPRHRELYHGGFSEAKGTRGSKQKRNITELLSCSRQSQIDIYSRSKKMDPSAHETMVFSWSFEAWAHKQARTVIDSRPHIKILYPWPWKYRGYRREILEYKYFYPKIGGHVFTPKFGKKNAGTQSFQEYVMKESIA